MGRHRLNIGVHIGGIGDVDADGSAAGDGTLFTKRAAPAYNGSSSFDEFVALESVVDVLRDVLRIWEIEDNYEASAAKPVLTVDRQDPLVSKALMPTSYADEVATVISDNSGSIEVSPKGALAANTDYFCGRETVRTGGSTSSTTTDTETWPVTRGLYLTTERTHFAGQHIYARPHRQVERPLRVYLIEDGVSSEVIWTGVVEDWDIGPHHQTIKLTARSIAAVFKNNHLNNRVRRLVHQGDGIKWKQFANTTDPVFDGSIRDIPADFNWWDPFDQAPPSFGQTHLQIGDQYLDATFKHEQGSETWRAGAGNGDRLFSGRNTTPEGGPIEPGSPAFQVFAVDSNRLSDSPYGHLQLGEGDTPILPKMQVLTIFLAHLLSTGDGTNEPSGYSYNLDIFSEDWGIGLPVELIDFEAWKDKILLYPRDTVDQWIWGKDGKTVDIWQTLKRWARLYNYVFVPNGEGKLIPRKIRSLSITDGEELQGHSAYIADQSAPLQGKADEAVVEVSGEYDGLPFVDASRATVNQSGSRTLTLLRDASASYDMRALSRDRDDIEAILEDHADKRREHPPQMEANFTRQYFDDSGQKLGEVPPLAHWLQIKGGPTGGLIGPTGDLEDPDQNQVTWAGLVITKKVDLERQIASLVVILWMWQLNKPTRLVAPTLVVKTQADAASTTGTDATGDWIHYESGSSNPVPDKNGGVGFMAGDEIVWERKDGRGFGDVMEVQSIDTGAAKVYVDSLPSEKPTAGDKLRCANEDQFSNTGWTGSSYWNDSTLADRRYCYITGPDGTFSSGEDADIYAGI